MTATTTLRRHLEDAGIHHEPRGRYMTAIFVGNVIWHAKDLYDGMLNLTAAGVLSPAQVVETLTGPHATMTSTCNEEGIGHSECDACGRTVQRYMHFCPWCGARFVKEGQ